MQIKTTIRYHYRSICMCTIKKILPCQTLGEDIEQLELSDVIGESVKWNNHFGKRVWQFHKKLNPCWDLAILLLIIYPREMEALQKILYE